MVWAGDSVLGNPDPGVVITCMGPGVGVDGPINYGYSHSSGFKISSRTSMMPTAEITAIVRRSRFADMPLQRVY